MSGNILGGGDADYLMQTQEAARQTVLGFKQFPWWNPWVSGGVPLFANPQYGLLSIQSITTLVFGSIWGYKLALFFYFVIGFWGFLLLFRKALRTPLLTSVLLSYIWTFAPGSELSVNYKDVSERNEDFYTKKYTNNLGNVLSGPQNNSLSVKVLYYVDYLDLKKKRKRS